MFNWMITAQVADTQKALLFCEGSFVRVLEPGRHRIFNWNNKNRIDWYDITTPEFTHQHLKFLFLQHKDLLGHYAVAVETGDQESALVYIDNRLHDVIPPGEFKAYWKEPQKVRIEKFDITENYEVSKQIATLLQYTKVYPLKDKVREYVRTVQVSDNVVTLLKVDGQIEKVLAKGNYSFWIFNRSIETILFDKRLQDLEVSGQEILTRDKVSLRLNLVASYKIIDPVKVTDSLPNYKEYLYHELQLALRDVIGTRNLDELLANKGELNTQIQKGIGSRAIELGIKLENVGIKDIILPGEMKEILNQVVAADKAAQANLIKRREETAATRSLMNTAKMMENNPIVLRLKELESLEKITEKIGSLTVYGGLDGILKQLVSIGGR